MTKYEAEIIVAIANYDMNVSKASTKLYMHRNTVVYHLKKIRQSTGLNPQRFHDLTKLLLVARKILNMETTECEQDGER